MRNYSRLDVVDCHVQHEVHWSEDGFHLLDHTCKEDAAQCQRPELASSY